ncbi:MAG: MAPEG family protein [Salinisphaera sp.]|nr:MAPEG family protein [Salinisphaera sp.]MDN5939482.1 MAPEG family protein [Salinisphaera sp.]
MNDLLSIPTVQVYAVCAALLVLKMWLTGTATGITRVLRKSYVSDEDYRLTGHEDRGPNPLVERLRRIHANDLESILPFLVIAFLYALTEPGYALAWWLFTGFTVARIAHTGAYLTSLQPWRSLFFEVGNLILLALIVLLLAAVA